MTGHEHPSRIAPMLLRMLDHPRHRRPNLRHDRVEPRRRRQRVLDEGEVPPRAAGSRPGRRRAPCRWPASIRRGCTRQLERRRRRRRRCRGAVAPPRRRKGRGGRGAARETRPSGTSSPRRSDRAAPGPPPPCCCRRHPAPFGRTDDRAWSSPHTLGAAVGARVLAYFPSRYSPESTGACRARPCEGRHSMSAS